MKKLLSGTTALVAAGLLSSGAYAADPIKLSLSGYFGGGVIMSSQDDGTGEPGANTRNHRIEREAEVAFKGSTTLDNGIKVGVDIQLEAETSGDQIDESFIWFSGSFGKIQFGAEDGPAAGLNVGIPKPSNFFWGAASPVFSPIDCGGNGVGTGAGGSCAVGAYGNFGAFGDQEKITYYTPKMGGAQLGISYMPENKELGAGGYAGADSDNDAAQQSEAIEIGAKWSGDMGGMSVSIGGGYKKGDLEVAAAGSEDREFWGLGVSITSGKLSAGIHYTSDNNATSANNTDRTDWALGVRYAPGGAWSYGVEYSNSEVEAGTAGGEDEGEAFVIGGNYNMGGGVSFQAEVQFWDISDNLNVAANENDATVFIVGTTIWF